jgi:lysosomal Pro-X carboxypeptidase
VELYVNHTGLMWETAPEAGALLVFAEHRYYGASWPFPDAPQATPERMRYLTSEQALADYAALLFALKARLGAEGAPVVAFGGSYGGMLAAWLRLHYPGAVDGAVAASAPIWMFPGEAPPADAGGFAEVVTRDASDAAGAPPACADNLRAAWRALFDAAAAPGGLAQLSAAFALCDDAALTSADDVTQLAFWLQSAFDYLSMGNFPYASDYLTNGGGTLPPWPMRAACAPLADATLPARPDELLRALRAAASVFYNVSGDAACFDPRSNVNAATAADDAFWGWQACTEMVMPQSRDGVRDAFWPQPYDAAADAAACAAAWGVEPRPEWATVSYGGRRLRAASNIVFSNGGLDPWRAGGVTRTLSRSLLAVDIPLGAHHLDLMFAHPDDPPCVRAARGVERREIARWVHDAYREAPPPGPDGAGDGGGGGRRRAAELAVAGAAGALASAAAAAAALLCGAAAPRRAHAAGRAVAPAVWSAGPGSEAGSDVGALSTGDAAHPWDTHAPLLPRDADEA